ncbi:hypothetical protein HK100_002853 [Physocladia obscura]|uniref:Adhesin domain-containing protein n=1 Tax=Physocladia obscura TaxID=109957 RepID=A0AAD5T736_9FUNG|nr:hypothetical protein HK100_002853 [Physocladia obscura]
MITPSDSDISFTSYARSIIKYLKEEPQPETGAFTLPASYTRLVVLVSGSSVGDAAVTVDVGTSDESHLVFATGSDKKSAQKATKVFPVLSADNTTLSVHIVFPAFKNKKQNKHVPKTLHTDIRITLPQSLVFFEMASAPHAAASLVWNGPDVALSFSVVVNVGTIRTYSPLNSAAIAISTAVGSILAFSAVHTNLLDLRVDAGEISLSENAYVAGAAHLHTNGGSITGSLRQFTSLDASVHSGSVALSLHPGIDEVIIKVKAKTGSISLDSYGFVGAYSARTEIGTVKVGGRNVHRVTGNTGWNGSPGGKGIIEASTNSGSVDLEFH